MNLRSKRKLASRIIGVGTNKIFMDPEWGEDIAESLTREDVSKLMKDNIIQVHPLRRNSRGRANLLRFKKMRGQRHGIGQRKGKATARAKPKDLWMQKIRAQRKLLAQLREGGYIDKSVHKKLYLQAKGGEFRSKSYLRTHIIDKGLALKPLPER